MSSFFDMICAFIVFLMAAAFQHFGASDGTALGDMPTPAPVVAQSHSESTISPDAGSPDAMKPDSEDNPVARPEDAATPAEPVMAQPPADRHSA